MLRGLPLLKHEVLPGRRKGGGLGGGAYSDKKRELEQGGFHSDELLLAIHCRGNFPLQRQEALDDVKSKLPTLLRVKLSPKNILRADRR